MRTSRTAAARIPREMLERLLEGDTITVNVPPNVDRLKLSMRGESSLFDFNFANFDGLFDRIFGDIFGSRRKSTSRSIR